MLRIANGDPVKSNVALGIHGSAALEGQAVAAAESMIGAGHRLPAFYPICIAVIAVVTPLVTNAARRQGMQRATLERFPLDLNQRSCTEP